MMDFNERVIPSVTANFQYKESLARYEFAKKLLRKGTRVLDIGCGTGYGSAALAETHEVTAIDNNKEAINYAKRHYRGKAKFLVVNALKLPFKDSKFDAICSFEAIEHIKDVEKFLKEVIRVLKQGGKFIMSTPNKSIHSPKEKLKSPYHVKEYTNKELANLLGKFFKLIEIRGQIKSERAKIAFKDFIGSQEAREGFVKSDVLGIRKIFPRALKEKIWKYLGTFFGRASQESLETKDFPIKSSNLSQAEYFVAICEK